MCVCVCVCARASLSRIRLYNWLIKFSRRNSVFRDGNTMNIIFMHLSGDVVISGCRVFLPD